MYGTAHGGACAGGRVVRCPTDSGVIEQPPYSTFVWDVGVWVASARPSATRSPCGTNGNLTWRLATLALLRGGEREPRTAGVARSHFSSHGLCGMRIPAPAPITQYQPSLV